jgi:hypothetical protein
MFISTVQLRYRFWSETKEQAVTGTNEEKELDTIKTDIQLLFFHSETQIYIKLNGCSTNNYFQEINFWISF